MSDFNKPTFIECYTKHKNTFIRFARSYTREIEVAEDIVCDAFADVWEILGKGEKIDSIPAYTLGVIKFKCLNYLRHQEIKYKTDQDLKNLHEAQNTLSINSLEAFDPSDYFSGEIEELVSKALQELSFETRNVFDMSRNKQLSNKEIANQLGISLKGVEFHISKALKHLRKRLKDYLTYILLLISFFH